VEEGFKLIPEYSGRRRFLMATHVRVKQLARQYVIPTLAQVKFY